MRDADLASPTLIAGQTEGQAGLLVAYRGFASPTPRLKVSCRATYRLRTPLQRDALLRHLREQVYEFGEKVYPSPGDAFAHVAVRDYFDLDDEEALEYCDVGGSYDKGIDAIWVDDENRRLVVVQVKWSADERTFPKGAVRDLEGAYRWLLRLAEGKPGGAAPRVIDAARRLFDLRAAEPDYPVHLFAIVAGDFTRGAREEAVRANDDLETAPAEIFLVTLDDLLTEVEARIDRDGGIESSLPTVTLSLLPSEYFQHDADPPALVASLRGDELAKAAHDWGFRLFMRNLRFLLPSRAKGSVNAGIEQTLRTPEGRERFWYYNNGIAILRAQNAIFVDETSIQDFIATPSPTGYRAIHLEVSVDVPDGTATVSVPVELQIRSALQEAWGHFTHAEFYRGNNPNDLVRDLMRQFSELLYWSDKHAARMLEEMNPRADVEAPT